MNKEEIKKTIEGMLTNMGIVFTEVAINTDEVSSKTTFVIKTKDSGILIGDRGETFHALNHIIKKIASKGAEDPEEERKSISVDVNDYQSSIIERLKTKATILANRARDLKSSIELEPMSSYERLVVHDLLGGQSNIKTESTGEGKDRRVVIKYVE